MSLKKHREIFLGRVKQPDESKKVLRDIEFARVRWREKDPDLDHNPAPINAI
jgi:hypothetical protein